MWLGMVGTWSRLSRHDPLVVTTAANSSVVTTIDTFADNIHT